MNETERRDDRVFTDRMVTRLPSVAVPAGLEAKILADFDRIAARRRSGLAAVVGRIGALLWPGVPVWQPASVLGLSLALGLLMGVLLPSAGLTAVAPRANTDSLLASTEMLPTLDVNTDL